LKGGNPLLSSIQKDFKKKVFIMKVLIILIFISVLCAGAVKVIAQIATSTEDSTMLQDETDKTANQDPGVIKFAFLAAAIAVGVGSLGAGIAVGYVGSAAMGTIGEKPELAGRALLFVGLAEGIAIYGLIIAIMVLGKV
jgi:V/A-type H+-transporting ATPase subunit K